jgi:hypothetical protein
MLLSKTNLEKVIENIMQLDSFADVEELTFPMKRPTAARQQEWLDEFMNRFETHIRGVLEEYTEVPKKIFEPTADINITKLQLRVNIARDSETAVKMREHGYTLIDRYGSMERDYLFHEYILPDKRGE